MLPGCSRSPAPPPDRPPPAVRVAAGAVVKNGCSGATRRGRFAAAAATGFEAVDALPSRVHWPLAGLASRTARAGRADDLRRLSTASAPLAAGRPSVGAASAANKATASAAARVALTRDERRAPKIGASRGASVVAPVGPPTPTSTTPPPLPPSPPPLPSASELPPEPPAPRGAGDGTAASAWEGGARYQRSTTSPAGRVAARRLARRAAWRSCEVDGVNTTPGMRWNAQPGGGGQRASLTAAALLRRPDGGHCLETCPPTHAPPPLPPPLFLPERSVKTHCSQALAHARSRHMPPQAARPH